MAIRNIITETDPTLRKKSKPITEFNEKLWQILDDMNDTMTAADGVGLAAVQVGILRRVFIIDVGEGLHELINPELLEQSGTQTGAEGCLSSPEEYGEVERPNYVKLKAQDRNGNFFEIEGSELKARALLHELDHLDGILFKDRAKQMIEIEEEKPKKRRRK